MSDRKRILVTACGSSIGLEVLKSLHAAGGDEEIVGTEVSWWGEKLAAAYCHQVVRMPRGDEPEYATALLRFLEEQSIDLAFVNTEPEIDVVATIRDQIAIPLSTPRGEFLEACLSKEWLHDRLATTGLAAQTRRVETVEDIEQALAEFGRPVWLRCATGPRGRGSIAVDRAADGWFWIDYWRRRQAGDDVWLAHEFLPGRNLNWTSIWRDGRLIVSSTGERLKYFLAEVAVSGITGNVSHCRLVEGGLANEVARAAIEQIGSGAHGMMSVDLREDASGNPRVTEINGRNAFRPLLYTQGGVNFPKHFVDLMLYDKTPALPAFDAGTAGWEMQRGMDFEPVFRSPADRNV